MSRVLFWSGVLLSAGIVFAMIAIATSARTQYGSAVVASVTTTEQEQVASSTAPVRSLRPRPRPAHLMQGRSTAPMHSLRPRARPAHLVQATRSRYGAWRRLDENVWMRDIGLRTCWVSKSPSGAVWTFGENVSPNNYTVTRNRDGKFTNGSMAEFISVAIICDLPNVSAKERPSWWQ